MKRIILLIAVCLFGVGALAQDFSLCFPSCGPGGTGGTGLGSTYTDSSSGTTYVEGPSLFNASGHQWVDAVSASTVSGAGAFQSSPDFSSSAAVLYGSCTYGDGTPCGPANYADPASRGFPDGMYWDSNYSQGNHIPAGNEMFPANSVVNNFIKASSTGGGSAFYENAQISQSYYAPFVPGSGLNGVGNWLRDNLSLWNIWLRNTEKECVMCGPSLSSTLGLMAGRAGPEYARVGRWMSPEELSQMRATGRVVESNLNGVTSVTSPPNSIAWTPPPGEGRIFVTFDVPASSVRFLSPNGWAKILGPNSFAAKLYNITEMPEVLEIEVLP